MPDQTAAPSEISQDQPPPKSAIDSYLLSGPPDPKIDPLAAGILMAHQKAWLEDAATLKLVEKGRRTGLTFVEALDATLIAAASRSAGGDNYFYIGDTKEKGREFCAVVGNFAKHVAGALREVEEYLFKYKGEKGEDREINTYRVTFASGFSVVALPSTAAAIRGLQGAVCIDEAAFHRDVAGVLSAVAALLIWGGKIRIISSHNTAKNRFNEIIKETRLGLWDFSLHRYGFDDAVKNGLYERLALVRGWTASVKGKKDWYRRIRRAYGTRKEAMREELDAIPREGSGTALPLVWIEKAMRPDYKVVRWEPPTDNFVDLSAPLREMAVAAWLLKVVLPLLRPLTRHKIFFGEDFGMRNDRSVIALGHVDQLLHRHVPLVIELWRCPYAQQKQVLFFVIDQLQALQAGIMDANGNGMALAQETRQKIGSRVTELLPSQEWYRAHGPRFREAFESQTIHLPADRDLRDDLTELAVIDGVIKVPRGVRNDASDGGARHGDGAMGIYYLHAATNLPVPQYDGYETTDDLLNQDGGDYDDEDRDSARMRRRFSGTGRREAW